MKIFTNLFATGVLIFVGQNATAVLNYEERRQAYNLQSSSSWDCMTWKLNQYGVKLNTKDAINFVQAVINRNYANYAYTGRTSSYYAYLAAYHYYYAVFYGYLAACYADSNYTAFSTYKHYADSYYTVGDQYEAASNRAYYFEPRQSVSSPVWIDWRVISDLKGMTFWSLRTLRKSAPISSSARPGDGS